MWTMDELVERVSAALAAEYSGAPNGRVRDLPDRRAIRWYTTTGLVDRPLGLRGRTALYGRRHLLQLVAVKRRQAEGHTLAAIQAELQGVSDSVLADVARVPEEFLTGDGAEPLLDDAPVRPRFWAAAPATPPPPKPQSEPAPQTEPAPRPEPAASWPGTGTADEPEAPVTRPAAAAGPQPPGVQKAATQRAETPTAGAQRVAAFRLRGGAILVVPGVPRDEDQAAIAAAAEPLLVLLADRGLLMFDDGSPS